MGVRGLMTFVEENQRRFYEKDKVHDCPLVIDGFGLLYHLYFGSNLDTRHGGEFGAFSEAIDRFFANLHACNIKPYVIFDGPIAPDKLPCVLSRLQDRITDVYNLLKKDRDSRARLMPIFAVDILFHSLASLKIPFAVSITDADAEIVAVANFLRCSVLSEDSDYYVYDVKNGYIPFQHFYWEEIQMEKQPRQKSLICQKYSVTCMHKMYGVPPTILPYLSILLGNDWVPRDTFTQLISKLSLPRSTPQQKHRKRKKTDSRVEAVLFWLSTKSQNEALIVSKIANSLSKNQREEVMDKVYACLALYREQADVSKTLEILNLSCEAAEKQDDEETDNSLEEIENLVRGSLVHPIAINLLQSMYVCLPVIMSNPRKPSPHFCAGEIRTLLYRVLLRKYRFKTTGAEFLFLQEYDKVDVTYKKSRAASVFTSLCPFCEQHHDLDEKCLLPPPGSTGKNGLTTSELVLKILRLNVESSFRCFLERNEYPVFCSGDGNFHTFLDIVMVSTLFWVKKTSPKPSFVSALVLTISWSLKQQFLNQKCAKNTANATEDTKIPEKRTDPNTKPISAGPDEQEDPLNGNTAVVESPVVHTTNISEKKFLDLLCELNVTTASGSTEILDSEFDVALLHISAEWLCILNAALLLHQVTECQSSKFAMQEFFTSSVLLHEVHARILRLLKSAENVKDGLESTLTIVGDRLNSLPMMKKVFETFSSFLLQQT